MKKYTTIFVYSSAPDLKRDRKRTIRAATDRKALEKAQQLLFALRKNGTEPCWELQTLTDEENYVIYFLDHNGSPIARPRE